jgi:hypothetical protein
MIPSRLLYEPIRACGLPSFAMNKLLALADIFCTEYGWIFQVAIYEGFFIFVKVFLSP